MRIVSWFSCGAASAVATKLTLAQALAQGSDVAVVRVYVPEEHPDNDRFAADCARWFGSPIRSIRSAEYEGAEDVWRRRRFMSGPRGAVCTLEVKKAPRWAFEAEWRPDAQVFGFTAEERDRAEKFRAQNPEVRVLTPLIDAGLSKDDCHALVERAGIERAAMYRLGFANNNCIGCVKAQSPSYWNRVRRHFPEVFARRAALSREIGCALAKATSGDRERIFLDELDPALDGPDTEPPGECSLLCWAAERAITAQAAE